MAFKVSKSLAVRVFHGEFRKIVGYHPVVELLDDKLVFTEGPVWNREGQYLLFSDIATSSIYRWRKEDGVTLWRSNSNMANGLAYDQSRRLLVCEHATSCVSRIEHDGSRTILVSHYRGRALNSPNDIVVAKDGTIFFTDPTYGRDDEIWGLQRVPELAFKAIFSFQPETGVLRVIADDFEAPNGLCLSADGSRLYVNDSELQHIRVFSRSGANDFTGGEIWAETAGKDEGSPDGMKISASGHVFCCGPGGIHVFNPAGDCLGVILLPPVVTNFAFGGSGYADLFVTASNRIYRIPLEVQGLQSP